MEFPIDHDLHCHSMLSKCSNDPEQTAENILRHAKRNGYSFNCREVNFFRSNLDIFLQEIQDASKEGKKIILVEPTMSKARSLATELLENKINCAILENNNTGLLTQALEEQNVKVPIMIIVGLLSVGYEIEDLKLIIS